jgi:adsorption protein B
LWRDRKGLLGNPLSLLANVIFFYGLTGRVWAHASTPALRLAAATFAVQVLRTVVRMICVARIYGVVFALGVPIRMVYANALNSAATIRAVAMYTRAKLRREPLKWLKTDHAYPHRAALLAHKRKLGEILVSAGGLTAAALESALSTLPAGVRLGEHLVGSAQVPLETVYQALSFQQGLPLLTSSPKEVAPEVAHALPEGFMREWKVLPFRIAEGSLFLASPEIPPAELTNALRGHSTLEPRFHLVLPEAFEELIEELL